MDASLSLVVEGQLLRPGDFHHAEGESDHGELRTLKGRSVARRGCQ
jgi:hypothetical protein